MPVFISTNHVIKVPRFTLSENTCLPLGMPGNTHRGKYQFASALVREVRNPLTAINLAMEVLRSEIKDDGLNVYLDIINRGSEKINNWVNEMLIEQ